MKNEQRIIVLSARGYSFKNENGEVLKGQTLHFIETDTLMPVKQEDETLGYIPLKTSIATDVAEGIKTVPAIYDASFTLKSDASRGITARITDLKFVKDFAASTK